MRKHATTLIAPLAALAVAGTIGAGPAQATGTADGHEDHHVGHQEVSVEVETSAETQAALDQAGASLDAVEPATEAESEDGTTEITFPSSEDHAFDEGRAAFDGGIALAGASAESTWLDPALDTSDWQVSFDVDGQRVDLLQVVPEDGDARTTGGTDRDHDVDLALTAEGAEALNAVTGDGTFAEGDVFGDAEPAGVPADEGDHEWGESDHGWGESEDESHHGWDESDHESDHEWGGAYQSHGWGR